MPSTEAPVIAPRRAVIRRVSDKSDTNTTTISVAIEDASGGVNHTPGTRILIICDSHEATVVPSIRHLNLPPTGNSPQIHFQITPTAAGPVTLHFQVFADAESSLLQAFDYQLDPTSA